MNKKKYIPLFLLFLFSLLGGCTRNEYAYVEGRIIEASGKTLSVQHQGLSANTMIDSIKLDEKGEFRFKIKRPLYPDFYRLEIGEKVIILGIDSTEKIKITANYKNIPRVEIEGSSTSAMIQQLRIKVGTMESILHQLNQTKSPDSVSMLSDTLNAQILAHRQRLKAKILQEPTALYIYYALFQQLDGHYIFSPYAKEDRPYFQAVATAYQLSMPDYERTKNFLQNVLQALKQAKIEQMETEVAHLASKNQVGFLDIALKNRHGYPQKLSSYLGVPLVLDFMQYADKNAVQHLFDLQALYEKYQNQLLEIYQVSLDRDLMLWQTQSSQKPWICVHDDTGAVALTYNVQKLPTLYLIDKTGEIVGKYSSVSELEKELKSTF